MTRAARPSRAPPTPSRSACRSRDPMADGVTIQRSSQLAIEKGVSLCLDSRRARAARLRAHRSGAADELSESAARVRLRRARARARPRSASAASSSRTCRTRRAAPLDAALEPHGLALVQMVTPATPPERASSCSAPRASGFVYAVTRTGVTGGAARCRRRRASYLDRVKSLSRLPVCAGFGVRTPRSRSARSAATPTACRRDPRCRGARARRRPDAAKFLESLRPVDVRPMSPATRPHGADERVWSGATLPDTTHFKNLLKHAGVALSDQEPRSSARDRRATGLRRAPRALGVRRRGARRAETVLRESVPTAAAQADAVALPPCGEEHRGAVRRVLALRRRRPAREAAIT